MSHASEIVIAAAGDLHCTRRSAGKLRPIVERMAEQADVIALCGDLTDYGTIEEAEVLAGELKGAGDVPIVAVLGNHDFECGKQEDVASILRGAGVTVLDGDTCELFGIGFAGVKGFAGGFQKHSLEPWGEGIVKEFVRVAMEESLKLESALARLETPMKVALLHYSPIRATVEGEPAEIIPFLGSRRLEEPIDRFPVGAVFHGHAHFGSPEGRTKSGAPVYNVAMPLLRRVNPAADPFRLVALNPGDITGSPR